VAKAT